MTSFTVKELRSLTHSRTFLARWSWMKFGQTALVTDLQEIAHKFKGGGCGQSNWLVHRHTPDSPSHFSHPPTPSVAFSFFDFATTLLLS